MAGIYQYFLHVGAECKFLSYSGVKRETAWQRQSQREKYEGLLKPPQKWGTPLQLKWILHFGLQCCVDKARTKMAAYMATDVRRKVE